MNDAITLDLPWPPSLNAYYKINRKTGRMHVSDRGKQFRKDVMHVCLFNRTINHMFKVPVHIHIDAHVPCRRKHDLDNLRKATYDALTAAGIWEDDDLVWKDSGEKHYPPVKGGLLRVTIKPLNQAKERK